MGGLLAHDLGPGSSLCAISVQRKLRKIRFQIQTQSQCKWSLEALWATKSCAKSCTGHARGHFVTCFGLAKIFDGFSHTICYGKSGLWNLGRVAWAPVLGAFVLGSWAPVLGAGVAADRFFEFANAWIYVMRVCEM